MGSKANVLLTTSAAPTLSPFSTQEKRPPIGIGFLISVLRQAGHKVFFIDNYLQPSNFLKTDYLQRNKVDYVGIYANTICFRDTLRMLHELEFLRRSKKWKGKIIVGGPHTSVALDTIPDFVDYVVQGEGEKAIIDIVEDKVKERVIRYPSIENLDELPMVAWDYFIHLGYNWGVNWFGEKPVFTMNTSRGCPFRCAFCSVSSIWGRRHRCFSAERIVSEIEYLVQKYGAKGIYFREDNFTVNRERLIKFCDLLLKKNFNIYWACESRVDTLDRELLKSMYRAGARGIYFGVESGSQKILDFLRKGITVAQIREIFKICHELNIKTAASIMVGVPNETEDDILETEKLLEAIKPETIWRNVFVGIPYSELYYYAIENRSYEFIDDRKLVYLKGHNERVVRYYGNTWDAAIPCSLDKPMISVILPVYNGEKYLHTSIKSILEQTYQDFELIIIDDASTDGTSKVLEQYTDPRIRILRNCDNIGHAGSRNRAISIARGKYIAMMDADDISLPHRFESQVRFLEENPNYALVGSYAYQIDESGQYQSIIKVQTEDNEIRKILIQGNHFVHGSVMIRRGVLLEMGGYDTRYKYAPDYDLFLRIIERYPVANLPEPLYCWRSWQAQISFKSKEEQHYYAEMARREARERATKSLNSSRVYLDLRNNTSLDRSEHEKAFRNHMVTGEISMNKPFIYKKQRIIPGLVSIIIPTFNCREWVCDAIEASLNQTYKKCEVIVIDDGSTDDTAHLLDSKYEGRIKYIFQKNKGLSGARNRGVDEAQGEYIQFLDADDVISIDKVEVQVELLKNIPGHSVCYCDYESINIKDNSINRSRYLSPKVNAESFFHSLITDWETRLSIPVHCFLFKSSIFHDFQIRFDESLPNHEDWDCWLKIFACNPRVVYVDRKMAFYRIKPSSMCSNRDIMRYGFVKAIIKNIDLYKDDSIIVNLLKKKKEEVDRIYGHVKTRVIAFYLPQFHPIPENDEWWGKGFTEWTNVTKAKPLFEGRYQPHLPADLGFYDLRLPEVREAQANLAREYGIYGFCYYHYWFKGKRLLERPFDEVLRSGKPDFPFCLCWANENWTRVWDGQEKEVLQKQEYSEEDDLLHIHWLAQVFKDKRYIRINGKPLFLIYKAGSLPNPKRTIELWRDEAKRIGIGEIYLCRVESTDKERNDPTKIGFDASVEFQPDWLNLGERLLDHPVFDRHLVYRYEDIVNRMLKKGEVPYKRFPCVTPSWDNSARRKSGACIFIESRPEIYEIWLTEVLKKFKPPTPEENIVFINAWNEWAEGNHLEPDQRFGRGYLEATRRALWITSSMPDSFSSEDKYKDCISLIEQNRKEEAIIGLEKLISHDPFHAYAHNDLGALYYEKKEIEQARWYLERAIELAPDELEFKENLANLYIESNHFEKAMGLYKQVLNRRPEDADVHIKMAHCYFQLGQEEEGFDYIKKVLDVDPENTRVKEYLSHLFDFEDRRDDCDKNIRKEEKKPKISIVIPNNQNAHIMDWEEPLGEEASTKFSKVFHIKGQDSAQEKPLVSVIVPTYNRPQTLVEAVQSILDQTYPATEIIVVNDAGIEVESLISSLNQRRNITYVKHDRNRGLAAARNTGLRLARGKYIAYLDDDDRYYPHHLETLVQGLQSTGFRVAYTDAYRAHQKKEGDSYITTHRDLPYSFDFDRNRILMGNFIPVLCVMHEKSCIDEVGGFDEALTSHEDWDLWIRISRKYPFLHIKKITCEFSWRNDGTTMTSSMKEDYLKTRAQIYEKYRQEVLHLPEVQEAQQRFLNKYRQELSLKSMDYSNKLENGKLERSVKEPPTPPSYETAQILLKEGEVEKAISMMEAFLQYNPSHALAHNDLGVLYYEKGRVKEACFHLKRAFELDPENPDILYNIDVLKDVLDSFEEGKVVDVSIIIPVFNQVEYTKRCIEKIYQIGSSKYQFEVIVVDNCSTDGTGEYLRQKNMTIKNLTYLLLEENKGFGEACNLGAKKAKGKYLVFLNNDTEVMPGWLNSLISFMESHPECGAVGAKLVYPDGRLQEAGGIIFSDGTGWNYGRGMNPSDPRFNFVREVDYCSGAALMVRKDLWDEIGGFDLRYAPAYYEDTDLCFEIRKRGYKVYYQPKSTVIHHEGRTAGTDLQSGFKKFQEINRAKFIEKWKNELKNQYINHPRNIVNASDRQVNKNILVIDAFLPFYDRASGSHRLFQILKILKKMKFHITFLARGGSFENQYRPILEDMGIEVFPGDYEATKAAGNKENPWPIIQYNSLFQFRSYDFALIEFWWVANYYVPIIKRLSPQTKIIIDSVDIHFVREIRESELKRSPELKKKALLNKEKEITTYKQADRIWVVTETDKNAISSILQDKPIDVIPNIHEKVEYKKSFEESSDLLFVGNFNHPPNGDAIHFFCKDIFPTILNKLPEIKLCIVGNNPPEEIKALSSPHIIVTGYVPELTPYLKMARISVNPLRYGAGMKGKIGEALSWGLPVVTTSIGAEGMGLIDGQEAMIADSPEEFAQKVIQLYQDPIIWRRLSENGKKKMEANWTPEAICKRLEEVFEQKKLEIGQNLVSILILTHNQMEYTKKCLESIFQHTDIPFELIIVDNGSKEGTPEYLKEIIQGKQLIAGRSFLVKENGEVVGKWSGSKKKKKKNKVKKDFFCQRFKVIFNEKNLGFAAGNNQGIAEAKGEYIVIMNNDVVVTPGWLKRMLNVAEKRTEIGIVGPMSNYVSGPQWVEKIGYDPKSLSGLNSFAQEFSKRHQGQSKPFWRVVGFCMLIKRAVIDRIGGLDERFGLGNFEDDDFSLRARLAGFESWIAEDCFVHHFGNKTFEGVRMDYRESLLKNWEIFKRKWGIPQETAYGSSFDLKQILMQRFSPNKHYYPYRPEELSLSRGEALFQEGDVEGAKVIFNRLLQNKVDHVDALNNLGVISFQEGEIGQAITYFKQGLELDPNHIQLLENLGQCFLMQKEFSEAKRLFEKAIALKPDSLTLLNSFGHFLIQAGDFSLAEEIYNKSYQMDDTQKEVGEILAGLRQLKVIGGERRVAL